MACQFTHPLPFSRADLNHTVHFKTALRFMQREMLVFLILFLFFNDISCPNDYLLCDLRLRGFNKFTVFLHVALHVQKYNYYGIWILFKLTFLQVLFFFLRQIIEGKIRGGILLKQCHVHASLPLRVLCTGWPGTCAMTEIQYLNVLGLAIQAGFVKLRTVWSLRSASRWHISHPTAGIFVYIPINTFKN